MAKRKGIAKGIVDFGLLVYLVSVSVTGTLSVTAGSTTSLTATAHFSNGTTANVTSAATWTTADATMATVSAGVVTGTGLTAGVAISASYHAISGSATVGVHVSFASEATGSWAQKWKLTLARASSATVRTGTSTIVTSGIGTDVARVGKRLDADTPGLFVECTRTNICKSSENPTSADWSAGVTVVTTYPDGTAPNGSTTTACKWAVTAGGYSRYFTFPATTGVKYTFSMWHQSPSGSITAKWQPGAATPTYSATTSWGRIDGPYTSIGTLFYLTPAITDAQTIRTWGHQCEVGEFPTSYIPTGLGATATRQGEQLGTTTTMALSGRLNYALKMIMSGASTEYGTDTATATLLYYSANYKIEWNTSTRLVTITVNGSTNTFTLSTWSRYDSVELRVSTGGGVATVAKIRVNGGAVTTLVVTGAALGSWTPPSSDIACQTTTKQTTCRINEIWLEVPPWAA